MKADLYLNIGHFMKDFTERSSFSFCFVFSEAHTVESSVGGEGVEELGCGVLGC